VVSMEFSSSINCFVDKNTLRQKLLRLYHSKVVLSFLLFVLARGQARILTSISYGSLRM
jgi:hypothetical protein